MYYGSIKKYVISGKEEGVRVAKEQPYRTQRLIITLLEANVPILAVSTY